jgi:hypothetical protein
MRPHHYTLTPKDVSLAAASLLQTHLKLQDHGPKCHASMLVTLLFYAAARISDGQENPCAASGYSVSAGVC